METRRPILVGSVGVCFGLLGACTVAINEEEPRGGGGAGAEASGASGAQAGSSENDGGALAGSGAGPTTSCDGVEPLPDRVEEDRTVGPGCVRMSRTTVGGLATLTILPGTTVEILPGGFLSVARDGDGAALVAVGTEDAPIVFTSAAARPQPGDWQCIRLGSSSSELEHVIVEYGGSPCSATGASTEAMVQVAGSVLGIANVTFQDSSSHGVSIQGPALAFQDNTFRRNADAGIRIRASQLADLDKPNVFEDEDEFILVDPSLVTESGTWTNQGVPYRAPAGFGSQGIVQLEAGVRFELGGSSMSVAKFDLLGTEADPVIITSAQPTPRAGDWGCIAFGQASRIEHAIIEYAGNGEGCTGASRRAALLPTIGTTIAHTVFRQIDGAALFSRDCSDMEAWCSNQFESLAAEPLLCTNTPTACL